MVLIWGLIAVFLVVALSVSSRSNKTRTVARAGYLDLCIPLFVEPRLAIATTGFARISGHYRGQMFDIQVVPDSLALRKLPCLWLLVTLAEKLPVKGTCDIMLRATGTETFSRFGELPYQIKVPNGFPEGCSLRTDMQMVLPAPQAVGQYIAGLDQARLKEVVVAPTGVRLVWLVQEADRGRYLLFRDAELGGAPLPPSALTTLMDGLCGLWQDVRAQAAPEVQIPG